MRGHVRHVGIVRLAGVVVAVGAVGAACTRDTELPTVTPASSSAAPTTVASTTSPPTSTVTAPPTVPATVPPTAPPTVPPTVPPTAPPTTPPLSLASLVLRSDGIGPFDVGAAAADVISRISTVLGPPATDAVVEYPTPLPDGRFARDASGEEVFVAPLGRLACFGNGLCIRGGGTSPADVVFVGWAYTGDAAPPLASGGGVTVGSRWSDFPAMVVGEGGCSSIGSGSVDGIVLTVLSEGTPFGAVDASGEVVPGRPDPADVVVIAMSAGEAPADTAADC